MGLIAVAQSYPLVAHLVDGRTELVVGWTDGNAPVCAETRHAVLIAYADGVTGFSTPGSGPVGSPPAKPPKISGGPRGIRP